MKSTVHTRTRLLGTTVLAGVGLLLASVPAVAQESMETVTVTGYRASLESSANAKRASIGFSEAVFAEDIAKFPDTNMAESLNRIPGITLTRDITGEGVTVAIRGLGTNFTKVTLNNAAIAIASTGGTDSANNNREVDLNMFPSELFTQLQVDKTPRAEMLEGGAAGNVNMRTRRPFDKEGLHFTYSLGGIQNSLTNGMGGNGTLVFSDTGHTGIGDVGVLIGITGKTTYTYTHGWEDGNAGWNTPSVTNSTLCGDSIGCDISGSTVSIGSNNMTIPATIPNNVTIPGYASGTTVDAAMLRALNPSLDTYSCASTETAAACLANTNRTAMTKLGNMLLPRLSRDMYERGTRDRYNGVASFEWRPSDNLHFYLDMIAGRTFNDIDRNDLDLGVRAGNSATPMIPVGTVVDSNNVTLSTTLYNATWGLEARHYVENGDFYSINPGMSWQVTDLLEVDFQANVSRSHFLRSSPTVMFSTCSSDHTNSSYGATTGYCDAPTGGVIAYFDNTSGYTYPKVTSNLDWNDPDNYQWGKGRVNMQSEKRYTTTDGMHLDVKYGGDEFAVRVGAAYDHIFRGIAAIDGSKEWTIESCAGYASTTCDGSAASLIPQSAVASYLTPGPNGYVAVNYDKFMKDSNFYNIYDTAWSTVNSRCQGTTSMWFATSSNTAGISGCYEERYVGLYGQVDGKFAIGDRDLNYNVGLRWVETHQNIISPTLASSNTPTYDGVSLGSTNYYTFAGAKNTYQAFLPSVNVVYHFADDVLVRGSVSRTMARPDVSKMVSTVAFSDTQASSITMGNPALKPYFSNNIDLGMEYYTGGEGYLSVAAFHKSISGFWTTVSASRTFSYLSQWGITYSSLSDQQKINLNSRVGCTDQSSCASAPLTVSQAVNSAGIMSIDGLEFGYVQPLDFLLEQYGFKGLGVTGNLTIVDQSSSGSAATHAQGVAPYTYNLTGYYDNDGIMARLSYVYTARMYGSDSDAQGVCVLALPSTVANSTTCTTGAYLFNSPYGQADFSSSLKLSRLVGDLPSDPELTFSIQNVFNAKQRSIFQYNNAAHSYYVKGQTFMFGVHGTF
jgi:TonB-dependent receptor